MRRCVIRNTHVGTSTANEESKSVIGQFRVVPFRPQATLQNATGPEIICVRDEIMCVRGSAASLDVQYLYGQRIKKCLILPLFTIKYKHFEEPTRQLEYIHVLFVQLFFYIQVNHYCAGRARSKNGISFVVDAEENIVNEILMFKRVLLQVIVPHALTA